MAIRPKVNVACKAILFLVAFGATPHLMASDPIEQRSMPDYTSIIPQEVRGMVYDDANANGKRDADEKGVPNVSVTDGYSVVSTQANGSYSLRPNPKAVFIYITRPSGYDVVGEWYQPVSPQVNFRLSKSIKDQNNFSFIHVTDTHIDDRKVGLDGLGDFVQEANILSPSFVINSGDLINMDKQMKMPVSTGRRYFENYSGIMDGLRMPYYNVAGDHADVGYRLDTYPPGDPRCGKAMFYEYFGPNFYSFEYGKIHFVFIDFVNHYAPDKFNVMLTPEQLRWFEEDIQHRTPGTAVVTVSENLLDKVIPNLAELKNKYNIVLQLTGDDHGTTFHPKAAVPARCGGSLSGLWWNHNTCADLSPGGYMVYNVHGDQLDCFYKGLGRQIIFDAPSYGRCVKGDVEIKASIVRGWGGEKLEYSVNGSDWKPMRKSKASKHRKNFITNLDSTKLPDGLVQMRVRLAGGSELQSRTIVIDNGEKRFTANHDGLLEFTVGGILTANVFPQKPVRVMLNDKEIGTVQGEKTSYSFEIPPILLKKVNELHFEFVDPNDGMTLRDIRLSYNGVVIKDPRRAAILDVCAKHWQRDIIDKMGAIVGEGIKTDSFAIQQEQFYFVLSKEAVADDTSMGKDDDAVVRMFGFTTTQEHERKKGS